MEQLSMFNDFVAYPKTYDDIETLFYKYIYEGEKDSDVFTSNEIKNGKSYFFYGKKVFSFYPCLSKGPILKIMENDTERKVIPEEIPVVLERLKKQKRDIFRNLITEEFACCNDFKECSKVGYCLYRDDRFYNGCYYRKNLEAGLNFFKTEAL